MSYPEERPWVSTGAAIVGVVTVVLVTAALMIGLPIYNVWTQGLGGQASLARAEQEKLILIEQAKAEVEAAKYRSEAIKTVGQAAKDFPEYRLQEFIGAFAEAMTNADIQKIIYVPTEANIPITEAGRR